jgi:hypothetical protein
VFVVALVKLLELVVVVAVEVVGSIALVNWLEVVVLSDCTNETKLPAGC